MRIDDDNLGRLAMIWLVSKDNPKLRSEIEDQLRVRSESNTNFSREFFYAHFTTQSKPVGVKFIPGTDAFIQFGSELVLLPCFMDEIGADLIKNIQSEVSTFGLVKADDVNGSLDLKAQSVLRVTGFNTQHVMEISFL
jgi:hypothetical protein